MNGQFRPLILGNLNSTLNCLILSMENLSQLRNFFTVLGFAPKVEVESNVLIDSLVKSLGKPN